MLPIDIVSRVLHVLTAIMLLGGSIFTLLVLLPSAKTLSDESHQQLASAVGGRWKRLVHVGILLLLATGLYNYVRAVSLHKGDSLYHALLGTKMLLALAVFFLASALVGRSKKLQPIRDQRKRWITVVVLMGIAIVAISGFVKVRGVPAGLATIENISTEEFEPQTPTQP
ncbi:hypothetical protein Pla52nx_005266 [Stieleria varia]|uniref:Copper resistance protein D n=2 Tax=Stieleria varia TaxID=2528005 RepID=A0A5C6B1H6_9BACT|nr:hypothetical protein Pla52n_13820 [Stieleria varia]